MSGPLHFGTTPVDVKTSQRASFISVFTSATPAPTPSSSHANNNNVTPWKVLIYDAATRDAVLTLTKSRAASAQVFRDSCVTLKMLVNSPRERVPDVTAVYILEPTLANIEFIAKDVSLGLYDAVHVNFASPCPATVLEAFARKVVAGASRISRVWDRFLSFIALDKTLFTLNQANSFKAYNAAGTSDAEVEAAIERAATGLTDALVSLYHRVPILRAAKDGPAEMVARRVAHKLHVLYKEKAFEATSGSETGGEGRPLVLVLDRGADMSTPLRHGSTYGVLVDDVLGPLKLNRIPDPSNPQQTQDLDPEQDPFWAQHADSRLEEATSEQFQAVNDINERVKRLSGPAEPTGESRSRDLMDAVSALPELTERKRSLALHGALMTSILKEIGERKMHKLHDLEFDIVRAATRAAAAQEWSKVEQAFQNSSDFSDRARLLCVYLFTARPEDMKDVDRLLSGMLAPTEESTGGGGLVSARQAGQAVSFAKRALTIANQQKRAGQSASSRAGGGKPGLSLGNSWQAAFGDVQERLHERLATVAHTVASTAAASALGNEEGWCPAARALDAVNGGSIGQSFLSTADTAEVDARYVALDPKLGESPVPAASAKAASFSKCMVFSVGGGCYAEHRGLKIYAAHAKKEIVYGCTELLSPRELLGQMADSV